MEVWKIKMVRDLYEETVRAIRLRTAMETDEVEVSVTYTFRGDSHTETLTSSEKIALGEYWRKRVFVLRQKGSEI